MADLVKLYVVLIFIPVAAIAVPAVLTWARDLDATARRMRQVDEQSKKGLFWDSWAKAATATMPHEEEQHTWAESRIGSLVRASRRELADAGEQVIEIYRSDADREFQKFELGFAEFQGFRAGLPWYRRAFLLYRAPNSPAK